MKPQNIYVVDGKNYDTSQEAVRAVERLHNLPYYYMIEWLDVTTNQDAADGFRKFIPNTVQGKKTMFEPFQVFGGETVAEGSKPTTARDVQEMIRLAENQIKTVLQRLSSDLPTGYVVTNTQVGCRAQSVVGGGREYAITADITVEVWAP